MKTLVAEVFATVPPESLTVIAERFAIDLFNRDAGGAGKYTDQQFTQIATETMKAVNERTAETDNGSARSAFAIIMFIRASNSSIPELADALIDTLQHDDAKEMAKSEWIPSALGKDGRTQGYEPLLEFAGAGSCPDMESVLGIVGSLYTAPLLGVLTGRVTDQMSYIETRTPILDPNDDGGLVRPEPAADFAKVTVGGEVTYYNDLAAALEAGAAAGSLGELTNNVDLAGAPGFIDYEGFNWELKPDAPARRELPNGTRFAQMGLYDSPWRVSPAVKHGEGMSRPRPIRTEFDQGEVTISVVGPKGGRWKYLSTATPVWREYGYEETVQEDGKYQIALIGGQGYKTMYDDVRVEGHPELNGTFARGGEGWTWDKAEKPSTAGECGTPHGVVRSDEAAVGAFVAMANNKNVVTSRGFKMKRGEKLKVTLKARQYVPDFIRPYAKEKERKK